ncbi:MAG TPA: class I SAM-dependent methyltransferase [Candidatus Gastranaerophilales bacterium]|nr:class I SAM-dependent methyltransferase [Candidatus Gastranaerophilales bacterium]
MKSTAKICPICGSKDLTIFLERKNVPVVQNFLLKDSNAAKNIEKENLKLAVCNNCEFVFNMDFDFSKLKYGNNYDNNQTCSAYFKEHMDKLVNHLLYEENIQNCKIIEIGSGNGIFLKKLVDNQKLNNTGVGFDPSYNGQTEEIENKLIFKTEYYCDEHSGLNADIIISRHVIEHIQNPLEFLRLLRKNLKDTVEAKVYFETPCVEWILKNKVIWDFFYEHCSYFSENSLKTAFEMAGFQVDKVEKIFGSQYLWIKAVVSTKKESFTPIKKESKFKELAVEFSKSEKQILDKFKQQLINTKSKGKTAVWGAGAKGVTFLNLIDPDVELVDFLVDINPDKQDKYIVGSGHKVVSPESINKYGIKTLIIMNPNYKQEIISIIDDLNLKLDLIEMEL